MQAPLRANADVAPADAEVGVRNIDLGRAGAMRVPQVAPDLEDVTATATASEPKVTIYRAETPQNFAIDLRLKPALDAAESDVVLRLRSPRDYYVVRLDMRDEKVTFARVSGGKRTEIASVDCRIAANTWHSVRVRAEENRFEVSLDGAWLFTAYDSALQSGRLAVWIRPGGLVQFDAIAVTPIGSE